MKLVCGFDLSPPGWYCSRPVKHEGPCAAHPTSLLPRGEQVFAEGDTLAIKQRFGVDGSVTTSMTALRTQSRKASLVEAIANTTIGFCLSWVATLSCMWLLEITMSFHQLWWYTWFMTGVSVVRSYWVRRMWNSEWWKRFKRKHPKV